MEKDDIDEIKKLKEELNEKAMALATKVYEEAAKANQANAGADTESSSAKDDDVQEAKYEEK